MTSPGEKMMKGRFYLYGILVVFFWVLMTLAIFNHRPELAVRGTGRNGLSTLSKNLENFNVRLDQQLHANQILLKTVEELKNNMSTIRDARDEIKIDPDSVIPVLMFACNRVTVSRALDMLLKYRKPERAKKFPIIVSQDCNHSETRDVIKSYGDQISYIQQPDQSDPEVPKAEKKFKGYFKISRHYGWALNQVFVKKFNYDQVIVVEDDLEVSPDFFEYFEATLPLLKKDTSLWCVSAWNDNGKKKLIDTSRTDLLYRTDFFGGLGWMLTRDLWTNELMSKWPKSYWDDWMRRPEQRRNRACLRPEVPRTKTFGKDGVSNGLFFEKHLKFIYLNTKFYPFTKHNLSYLLRQNYDRDFTRKVQEARAVTLAELKAGPNDKTVKLFYKTKADFKALVQALGIMEDTKSGVPRMAYKGIISTVYKGTRVYLTQGLSWKGYNSTW